MTIRNKIMIASTALIVIALAAAGIVAVSLGKAPALVTKAEIVPKEMPSEAREEVNAGIAAAAQGDYKLAISHFEKARRISPFWPEILFNLGLANDKLGSRELVAIPWYYAYLEAAPKAENAAQTKSRITALRASYESRMRKLLNWDRDLVSQMNCEDLEVYVATSHGESMIAHYEIGDNDGINATAMKITNAYWRSEMYRDLVLKQLEAGDIEGALTSLASMSRSDEYTVEAYCVTAEALAKAGRRNEALALIEKAGAFIPGIKKEFIDKYLSSYMSMARTCASLGDKEAAAKYLAMYLKLAEEGEFHDMGFGIDARSQRIWAYAAYALEAAKQGFKDEAVKGFELAKEECGKYQEYKNKLLCLSHVAGNQKEAGFISDSLKTIQEARSCMQWITPADREKYASIDGRYDLSPEDDAWRDAFKDRNFAAGYLVKAYVRLDDLKSAQEALDSMVVYREGSMSELGKAYARKGDTERAITLAKDIKGYNDYDRASLYAEVAKKQAELRDIASAEANAKLTVSGHENDANYAQFHDGAYNAIIAAMIKKRDYSGARRTAANMISLKARYLAYCDIAKAEASKAESSKSMIGTWSEIALRNGSTPLVTDLPAYLKSLVSDQEKAEDTVAKVISAVRAMAAAQREIEILSKAK